jgi:hypothetical protein
MPTDDLPVLAFGSAQAWQDWLAEHHHASPGLWLKIAKKGSGPGAGTVSYAGALDFALCFGWIDGQKAGSTTSTGCGGSRSASRATKWSKSNRGEGGAADRRGPDAAGRPRELEEARADGRWEASVAGRPPQGCFAPPTQDGAARGCGQTGWVRIVVTQIGWEGRMRRRALDTSGLTDAGRWENLVEQVLAAPPPYRAAPGRPVYVILAGDRAVLLGEQDLTEPLFALVETILETGEPPLPPRHHLLQPGPEVIG